MKSRLRPRSRLRTIEEIARVFLDVFDLQIDSDDGDLLETIKSGNQGSSDCTYGSLSESHRLATASFARFSNRSAD